MRTSTNRLRQFEVTIALYKCTLIFISNTGIAQYRLNTLLINIPCRDKNIPEWVHSQIMLSILSRHPEKKFALAGEAHLHETATEPARFDLIQFVSRIVFVIFASSKSRNDDDGRLKLTRSCTSR